MKYVIGGLSSYQFSPQHLKRKNSIKQTEIVNSMSKIGHESGILAWAVEVKTGKIGYFGSSKTEL